MSLSDESKREAFRAVHHATALLESEHYQWLHKRITDEVEKIERTILDDDAISSEERETLRHKRKGMLAVLSLPNETRDSQTRVLGRAGVKPGDAHDVV